jgi:hypothetical protein
MRDWGAFKTMHIISMAAQVDGARLELTNDGMVAVEKMWLKPIINIKLADSALIFHDGNSSSITSLSVAGRWDGNR